jgi:hypothetical protein
MTKSIIAGALGAVSLSMAATAGFTGFTTESVVLSNGNVQYKVYANFDNVGLPTGQSWVFLNAYSHDTVSGTMNAVHHDFAVQDGEVGTWLAGSSVSAADRDFDSWITSSGLATSLGWGTAIDPGWTNGGTVQDVNNGAGWYDATPPQRQHGDWWPHALDASRPHRCERLGLHRQPADHLQGEWYHHPDPAGRVPILNWWQPLRWRSRLQRQLLQRCP